MIRKTDKMFFGIYWFNNWSNQIKDKNITHCDLREKANYKVPSTDPMDESDFLIGRQIHQIEAERILTCNQCGPQSWEWMHY